MGISYLSTLIDKFKELTAAVLKRVCLESRSVVMDGNSAMYFIYDKMVHDDESREKSNRLTKTDFGHDGYGKVIKDMFRPYQDKQVKLIVVFDGVYQRHPRRRPDPERTSSTRFASLSGDGNRLPLLFDYQFQTILTELRIEWIVAHGEADPMIVELAKERNAVVVAGDSDYHLVRSFTRIRSIAIPGFETTQRTGLPNAGCLWRHESTCGGVVGISHRL